MVIKNSGNLSLECYFSTHDSPVLVQLWRYGIICVKIFLDVVSFIVLPCCGVN